MRARIGHNMKTLLINTMAAFVFSTSSFAVEAARPVGQAQPSFYLAQDTATMTCQIVEIRPAAGSRMKAIGTAHSTRAAAETALIADKTCANPFEVSKREDWP